METARQVCFLAPSLVVKHYSFGEHKMFHGYLVIGLLCLLKGRKAQFPGQAENTGQGKT